MKSIFERHLHFLESQRKWSRNVGKDKNKNINKKIILIIRSRICSTLRKKREIDTIIKDLGCSALELRKYIESKFKKGMNWNNRSVNGWHLDHIIPLSSFNLIDNKQLLKASHYSNLQPLWSWENREKGDKIR